MNQNFLPRQGMNGMMSEQRSAFGSQSNQQLPMDPILFSGGQSTDEQYFGNHAILQEEQRTLQPVQPGYAHLQGVANNAGNQMNDMSNTGFVQNQGQTTSCGYVHEAVNNFVPVNNQMSGNYGNQYSNTPRHNINHSSHQRSQSVPPQRQTNFNVPSAPAPQGQQQFGNVANNMNVGQQQNFGGGPQNQNMYSNNQPQNNVYNLQQAGTPAQSAVNKFNSQPQTKNWSNGGGVSQQNTNRWNTHNGAPQQANNGWTNQQNVNHQAQSRSVPPQRPAQQQPQQQYQNQQASQQQGSYGGQRSQQYQNQQPSHQRNSSYAGQRLNNNMNHANQNQQSSQQRSSSYRSNGWNPQNNTNNVQAGSVPRPGHQSAGRPGSRSASQPPATQNPATQNMVQIETAIKQGSVPLKSLFQPVTEMPEIFKTMFDQEKGVFTVNNNGGDQAKAARNQAEWNEQRRLLTTAAEDLRAQDENDMTDYEELTKEDPNFQVCYGMMNIVGAWPIALSDAQFKACCAVTTRPLLVFAGPGSGKTRFLASRAAAILTMGQRGLCALTYTCKASKEMKSRIAQQLRLGGHGHIRIEDKCQISTIHAFCKKIITHFSTYVFNRRVDKINIVSASPFEMSKVAEQLLPGVSEEEEAETFQIEADANANKALSKTSPQLVMKGLRDPNWLIKQDVSIQQAVVNYVDRLRVKGAVDLCELVSLATDLLSRRVPGPAVARFLQENVRFLLIDELQDCDQYELALFRILHMDGCHITAVGDDDQSIFDWRFQESVPIDCFGKMRKLFTDAQVTSFAENYRCPPPVVRVMRQLIDHNKKRFVKDLKSHLEGKKSIENFQPVRFKLLDDVVAESQFVVQQIQQIREQTKCMWSDFAVLSRLQEINREIVQALRNVGIPVENQIETHRDDRYNKNNANLGTAACLDLFAWMRMLIEPDHRGAFLRAYRCPSRRLNRKNFLMRLPWQAVDANFRGFEGTHPLHGPVSQGKDSLFQALIHGWNRNVFPHQTRPAVQEFIKLHDKLSACLQKTRSYQQVRAEGGTYGASVADMAAVFMKESNFEKRATTIYTGRTATINASMDEFMHHAKQYRVCAKTPTLALAVFQFLSDASNGLLKKEPDAVQVSTIHSAKGLTKNIWSKRLEWKHVFVIRANQGILPMDDNKIEEERRLMYVAGTRASVCCTVTAAKQFVDHQGKMCWAEKTPFIAEMGLDGQSGTNYGMAPGEKEAREAQLRQEREQAQMNAAAQAAFRMQAQQEEARRQQQQAQGQFNGQNGQFNNQNGQFNGQQQQSFQQMPPQNFYRQPVLGPVVNATSASAAFAGTSSAPRGNASVPQGFTNGAGNNSLKRRAPVEFAQPNRRPAQPAPTPVVNNFQQQPAGTPGPNTNQHSHMNQHNNFQQQAPMTQQAPAGTPANFQQQVPNNQRGQQMPAGTPANNFVQQQSQQPANNFVQQQPQQMPAPTPVNNFAQQNQANGTPARHIQPQSQQMPAAQNNNFVQQQVASTPAHQSVAGTPMRQNNGMMSQAMPVGTPARQNQSQIPNQIVKFDFTNQNQAQSQVVPQQQMMQSQAPAPIPSHGNQAQMSQAQFSQMQQAQSQSVQRNSNPASTPQSSFATHESPTSSMDGNAQTPSKNCNSSNKNINSGGEVQMIQSQVPGTPAIDRQTQQSQVLPSPSPQAHTQMNTTEKIQAFQSLSNNFSQQAPGMSFSANPPPQQVQPAGTPRPGSNVGGSINGMSFIPQVAGSVGTPALPSSNMNTQQKQQFFTQQQAQRPTAPQQPARDNQGFAVPTGMPRRMPARQTQPTQPATQVRSAVVPPHAPTPSGYCATPVNSEVGMSFPTQNGTQGGQWSTQPQI